ncbi:Hypothetical predicted protein [Lecanosticta acicola]|uniref:Uncharacterized protein n=1 Tax=Lecanosticta acicola TaxID=111012 RepID=A0AAI8Z2Q3_9PEZI|nr:Hypothetical predicted protein [Lecanosticta acicola]
MSSTHRTGVSARGAARENTLTAPTSGLAPGHVQANLIVLPSKPSHYAQDFRRLCLRNPVALPLIAEGGYDSLKSHLPNLEHDEIIRTTPGFDLRRDVPKYTVYRDGKVVGEEVVQDIRAEWQDHVAFLTGSSFTFVTDLAKAGLAPRQPSAPLYVATKKHLYPSGIFYDSPTVVSMRAYSAAEIGRVREITAPFVATHGEPIDWGWGAVDRLGIEDINTPAYGDAPLTKDGKPFGDAAWTSEVVPVFWASGVTALEAVKKAELEGTVMVNKPDYMLLLDCQVGDVKK